MKINIFIILLLIFSQLIAGAQISEYNPVLIKKIIAGPENGVIGFEPSIAGSPSAPYVFMISKNEKIYIPDIVNQKLEIYDLAMNSLRTINNTNGIEYAQEFQIDDSGNIIFLNSKSVKKIDSNGKLIFEIENHNLPRAVVYESSLNLISDTIFFYDDAENIKMINNNGTVLNETEAFKRLSEIRNNYNNDVISQSNTTTKSINLSEQLVNNNKKLLIGNDFYSADFDKLQSYFKSLKSLNIESISKSINTSSNELLDGFDVKNYMGFYLIGYDKDHNSYWQAHKKQENPRQEILLIYSRFGKILDVLHYGKYEKEGFTLIPDRNIYPTTGAKIAVSWDGDVYFLQKPLVKYTNTINGGFDAEIISEKAYYMYRLTRQW